MVGMNQMKKKLFTGIGIGAAIGVVGIGLTLWWSISTIKSYEAGTNKKYNRLYTQDVAVLNREVIQGEVITSDMVTTVNVHKRTVPTGALGLSDITGQVAKFNIPASIPITQSMITSEIVSADVRDQEINTILMPSDLIAGDYVDVRIMYPNGTDYIVLAQKQVGTISGSTMWLTLTEDERLILNGAMVDTFLNEGTKLYATKYTDPEAQVKIADETDSTLRGYMLDVIAKTFGLEVSQEDINNSLPAEEGKENTTKPAVSADMQTVNSIFDLITKYKNYASTLTRTAENYQPNSQIISMMKTNANVLQDAKNKLSIEARQNIESGLSVYKSEQGDDYKNVVEGAESSIEEQKNERQNLLGV
mgnify:CR=1 FL=1